MKIISNIIFEFCWYAAILWSCTAVTGKTNDTAGGGDEMIVWLDYKYSLGDNIQLSCAPGSGGDPAGYEYTWRKDGTSLEDSALKGRYELVNLKSELNVRNTTEDDYGSYTCVLTRDPQTEVGMRGWRVRAIPELTLPSEKHVLEGYDLVVTCDVRGKPYPTVSWSYKSEGAVKPLSPRAERRNSGAGVPGGELLLKAVLRSDAGVYTCSATEAKGAASTDVLVDHNAGGLSSGAIVGIVLAVLLAVTLSIITSYIVYRKRKGDPIGPHDWASWRKLLRKPDSDT